MGLSSAVRGVALECGGLAPASVSLSSCSDCWCFTPGVPMPPLAVFMYLIVLKDTEKDWGRTTSPSCLGGKALPRTLRVYFAQESAHQKCQGTDNLQEWLLANCCLELEYKCPRSLTFREGFRLILGACRAFQAEGRVRGGCEGVVHLRTSKEPSTGQVGKGMGDRPGAGA